MNRILVIESDSETLDRVQNHLRPQGYVIDSFLEPLVPMKKLEKGTDHFDLILTEIKASSSGGLGLVEQLRKVAPDTPIIAMAANGTVETAVQAVQSGAQDFLLKPLQLSQLQSAIERAVKPPHSEKESEISHEEVRGTWSPQDIIGESSAIQSVLDLVKRVAPSSANILISGESGTGKELIARAIHLSSSRAKGPFVAINCSAIPDTLLESELFGHVRGAYTGAFGSKLGLFEEANGGVLFLDEIGDMNLALQTKLLRVLQERKIRRIGENQFRPINVRVIAATHRNLKTEIRNGTFRDDLYYRLCVVPIEIPPLRERREDILPIAEHFLKKFSAQNQKPIKGFSKAAAERMVRMPWPGNVRELENAIERAVVLSKSGTIEADDMPPLEMTNENDKIVNLFGEIKGNGHLPTLEEISKDYIHFVYCSVNCVKEKAAKVLNIDRKTLYRKLAEMETESSGPLAKVRTLR